MAKLVGKLSVTALMAVVIAAAAAGCGGASSSAAAGEATTTPGKTVAASSLGKAEFVKRANGICGRRRGDWRRGLGYFVREAQHGGKARGEAVVEAVKLIEAPTVRVQTEEIGELGAPHGDRRQVGEFLDAFERAEEAALGLESMKAKATVDQLYIRAGLLARRYGLDECASPLAS